MHDKWTALSQNLANENGAILTERTTPKALQRMHALGLCVIEQDPAGICGCGCLWPNNEDIYDDGIRQALANGTIRSFEIGSIWIRADQRGRGRSSHIFSGLVEKVPEGICCFVITRAPTIMHLCKQHGFREGGGYIANGHASSAATCTLCTPSKNRKNCTLRTIHEGRQLFVRLPLTLG